MRAPAKSGVPRNAGWRARRRPALQRSRGELANVGTAAAIANAVYHATGKRIRQLPIRIENLLTA